MENSENFTKEQWESLAHYYCEQLEESRKHKMLLASALDIARNALTDISFICGGYEVGRLAKITLERINQEVLRLVDSKE